MAEKGFQHRAALLLILVFTILLTFFGCLHTLGTTDKTISKTSTSLSTLDDEISDQIIVSAKDYLELTTCGNLEEAPTAADAADPVRRPIVELTEDEMDAIRALDTGKGSHDPDDPANAERLLAFRVHD
jgi:hypothetical protein